MMSTPRAAAPIYLILLSGSSVAILTVSVLAKLVILVTAFSKVLKYKLHLVFSFKFVAYGYYGISSVTAFSTLADLKALSGQNTSGSKNLAWNGINCTFQNMIYAYPASYGVLSKVMYAGFDYVTSFTQTTQNITMPDGTVQAFFIYSLKFFL